MKGSMNAYQFMSSNPWLAFFLAAILAALVSNILGRFMRHLDISKHGWPPAHCDADGDFQEGQSETITISPVSPVSLPNHRKGGFIK